jgi:hypothetical protein
VWSLAALAPVGWKKDGWLCTAMLLLLLLLDIYYKCSPSRALTLHFFPLQLSQVFGLIGRLPNFSFCMWLCMVGNWSIIVRRTSSINTCNFLLVSTRRHFDSTNITNLEGQILFIFTIHYFSSFVQLYYHGAACFVFVCKACTLATMKQP